MSKDFPPSSPNDFLYPSGQSLEIEESHTDCSQHGGSGIGGFYQTIKEMDFQRGPWSAAADGDYSAIEKYLTKGGEPNLCDSAGYTPLHYSARNGHENISDLLLQHGAFVNSRTSASQSTPLHRAAMKGCSNIVALLLRYNADPCCQDLDGKTPLHKAVEGNNSDICRMLVENNPKCSEIPDKSGKEPKLYVRGTLDGSEVYKVLKWTKHT